jgi:hypothetical protein
LSIVTTLLDHVEAPPMAATSAPFADPARRLRATMAACRVQFTWLGTQKSLTPEQRARAASAFDADAPSLSAGKKILDTRHPTFRAVTAVRGQIEAYWRGLSLPFPEPGVRLLRQDGLDDFDRRMSDYRVELVDAAAELDHRYGELRDAAARRLGSLYNPADYPQSLAGLFGVAWDFPALGPPDYLVALSPELYERERQRVIARFEEAVGLAERAFTEEFARLVEHLAERLTGQDDDGTPKVFRDSAVGNLEEFFARFRALSVRSDAQLEALVAEAQRVVRGVGPQELRDRDGLRRSVAAQLGRVQVELDRMLVERPRRRIMRTGTPGAG